MTEEKNWRNFLTASERYDNVEKLTKAVAIAGLNQSAFSIENEAYKTAKSREEYDATCSPPATAAESLLSSPSPPPPATDNAESGPGSSIGNYQNCHYVASGVTSEVYRSQARALKVIVETHGIEPHNPHREAKILKSLRDANAPNIIPLLETFHDQDQRLVLVFCYMPLTLSHLLDHTTDCPRSPAVLRTIFTSVFRALHYLHTQGIIHRDIKPTALLLTNPSPSSPSQIYLSDFGTAWHPFLSAQTEPAHHKILDIGTGPYRAPETLFGNRAYGAGVDLWAAGATLAECLLGLSRANGGGRNDNKKTLFESRSAHEDGNQLGLILSIFQTLGTPTRETWPEAVRFRTPPFEMYRVFEGRVKREGWEAVLPGVAGEWRELVRGLVRYESAERVTAGEALDFPCLKGEEGKGDCGD